MTTTRATENKRLVYSGYKLGHGFYGFQVQATDGLPRSDRWRKIGDWRALKDLALNTLRRSILHSPMDRIYTYTDGTMGPYKTRHPILF
ncbi:hypothetical protein V1506DRAFT_348926 [Lipomyces tetrasporus]